VRPVVRRFLTLIRRGYPFMRLAVQRGITGFIAGAFIATLGVGGVMMVSESDRERAESLQRDNDRLSELRQQLAERNQELEKQQARLEEEKRKLEKQRQALEQVVERLNLSRRVARIDVLEQHVDDDGEPVQTVIRFTETGRNGQPLPSHTFGVPGNVPHFDALIVKFDDDYVARGDQLRGQSLSLFRRVYGDTQAPNDGYWLGRKGQVPEIYRVDDAPSEFEVTLWRKFWSYATDPDKAAQAGVRVAQGEAVYAPMSPGQQWHLSLDADGGLNLTIDAEPAPDSASSDTRRAEAG